MKKEIKFAPGCFDSFDGSQEELNDLMKEIMELIQSEGFEDAEIVIVGLCLLIVKVSGELITLE